MIVEQEHRVHERTCKERRISYCNDKSMNRTISVLLIVILCSSCSIVKNQVSGFNVDTESPLIHRGPTGSYFGYGVAQHKDGRASWLLVGAPLAQTNQPMVEKGGAVYKCSPDLSQACQQVPFDLTGSGQINIRGKMEQVDEKSNQWFGSTVHSSGKTGMIVV